jgi:hypothetical protein
MIFMRSIIIVGMSQIKLISTPSWLVYFVLKAQPFFNNFGIALISDFYVLKLFYFGTETKEL